MNIKPIVHYYYTDDRPIIMFKSRLKTLYKKGQLPIKYGIYGEKLTKSNVSDEHVICRCFGGTSDLKNIVLASKEMNNARGNQPIGLFVTYAMLKKYLSQFLGIKRKDFDGDEYIKGIKNTFKEWIDD